MKLGRFSIPVDLVRQQNIAVKRIMSQCIIVRAEMMFINNVIEYEAISWRFREVPEGQIMPNYVWSYDDKTGELNVEEQT